MVGLLAVGATSDVFPAIMVGVPGSAGGQATVVDGYPLARAGQAERALGATFTASLLGGLIGAFSLFILIFLGRPLINALQTPELLMLCVLGLCMVAVLSQGALVAGLVAGLFGMLLGLVGTAPAAAGYRYIEDTVYLRQGIPLTIVAISVFAIPEILQMLIEGKSISRSGRLEGGGLLKGMREALGHKMLILRSSIIGTVIGVLPGLGGAVVDWIAYAVAKRAAKDSSQFGKGDIRGVMAPEAANNADKCGAMVPTLFFGIPGSGTTAVILVGFSILGLQVGPDMLDKHLDITLATVWTLVIANVAAVIVCLLASKWIARVSVIPGRWLAGFLLVLLVAAAWQTTNQWGDIWLFLVLGAVGYFMKHAGIPRPPVIIGFVLSAATERYLHVTTSLYGYDWLMRPGVISIGLLTIALLFGPVIRNAIKRKPTTKERVENV